MPPRRPADPPSREPAAGPDPGRPARLTSPADVRRLLEEAGIRPRRSWGQNFLIDANVLRILLDAAELRPDDGVLEIGPGLGVLTEALAARVARVVAIEKDERLLEIARRRMGASSRVEWIAADALDLDLDPWLAGGFGKVVSNLPYSAGTDLIRALARSDHRPERIVVTLQSDVVDRLAAAPGDAAYGPLSVAVQLVYAIRRVHTVSRTCFLPVPDVRSAVVRLDRRAAPRGGVRDVNGFAAFVRSCFAPRRKQMRVILSGRRDRAPDGGAASDLEAAGVPPAARPGDLAVDDWCRLWAAGERRAGRRP